MAEYRIIEVNDAKDIIRFVRFPDNLYRGCPQYVPALHTQEVRNLTKDAALEYCVHKMWMALDGGKVVGRICAMINPRYNERYGKKCVRFGWFDTIKDIKVARLLIETAEAWAKEQGMDTIHGPLYYNTLGKQGMLVEGYENIPPFNCLYNFPYYNDFMEQLGFEKECDWVQYKMVANHGVMMRPYVVERVQTASGTVLSSGKPRPLGQLVDAQAADRVAQMMREVVTKGTGRKLSDASYEAAGKTGSAEFKDQDTISHAWFTGFAPASDPQICVTVVLEGAGSGGDYAVPMARRVLDAWFLR